MATDRSGDEIRLHGLNAILAVLARRPGAIRKVWLREDRIPVLQPLLKWCAANRVGYRVVEDDDLRKLAASSHHEGVVADVLREPPLVLADWLERVPAALRHFVRQHGSVQGFDNLHRRRSRRDRGAGRGNPGL